jgi:hypothetical protein
MLSDVKSRQILNMRKFTKAHIFVSGDYKYHNFGFDSIRLQNYHKIFRVSVIVCVRLLPGRLSIARLYRQSIFQIIYTDVFSTNQVILKLLNTSSYLPNRFENTKLTLYFIGLIRQVYIYVDSSQFQTQVPGESFQT